MYRPQHPDVPEPLILYGRTLEQTIDRHERATFVKELVVTGGQRPAGDGPQAPRLERRRHAGARPARPRLRPEPLRLAPAGAQLRELPRRRGLRRLQPRSARPRPLAPLRRATRRAASTTTSARTCRSPSRRCAALTGERPVFLVGHSLGGLVSYAAAPLLAGAVAGIVLDRQPVPLHARLVLAAGRSRCSFEAMRRAGRPHIGLPVPLYPIGAFMRTYPPRRREPVLPDPAARLARGLARAARPRSAPAPRVRSRGHRRAAQHVRVGGATSASAGRRATTSSASRRWTCRSSSSPGTNDDLAPPASVRPAFERSRSKDKTYRTAPLGHIDLLVGRDAPLTTWPLVTTWIEKRAA